MRLFPLAVILLALVSLAGIPLQATDLTALKLDEISAVYRSGNGMGYKFSISLTPERRFTYLWEGCGGTITEVVGSTLLEHGVLKLSPAKAPDAKTKPQSSAEYYPVVWGERLYLIEPKHLPTFCSAVNAGDEPRANTWGSFYLREGDWEKPAPGRPEVPEAWAKYLLDAPVSGRITKSIRKNEAWANIGTQHGILEGMVLFVKDDQLGISFPSHVRVEVAEKERCRIKCISDSDRIKAGQTITSRYSDLPQSTGPKNFPAGVPKG